MFFHLADLTSVARHAPENYHGYHGLPYGSTGDDIPATTTREDIEAWLDDAPTGVAEILIEIDFRGDTLAIQGTPEQLRTLSRQIATLIDNKDPA